MESECPNYIGPGMRYWTANTSAPTIASVSLLDETLASKIRSALGADPKIVIRAVTTTFKPLYHKFDNKVLEKLIRDELKSFTASCRGKFYSQVHFEYHKESLILHSHMLCYGSKSTLSRLFPRLRNMGYVLTKTPNDIVGWISYLNEGQPPRKLKSECNVKPARFYYTYY